MRKILLIIKREYLTRIKKRSFIIMTLLTPLLIAGIYGVAIYFAIQDSEVKMIHVLDESGMFRDKLPEYKSLKFDYIFTELEESKAKVKSGDFYGLIHIPDIDISNPEGIAYYGMETIGAERLNDIRRAVQREIEDIRYAQSGIDKALLDSLKTPVGIKTFNLSGEEEKESSAGIATAVGFFLGFLIYLIMIIYGTQVMRGVVEEKSSKIVEIIISSVRPFQLMMGKILGIGAVGLSQFLIWVVLTVALWGVVTNFFSPEEMQTLSESSVQTSGPMNDRTGMITSINESINNLNLTQLLITFVFYFLGGYLFYAALFAMIGSAVDNESDTQQFTFPVMLPIIFSFVMVGAILKEPHGSIAFWLSVIPFTSPVTMMIRIPFGVPAWEILVSMVCLAGGFIFTTWFAGRVYRVGILMFGTKVNYKTLMKWFMMKT